MKIAVISDVHGNYEALKTTISDIKARGIDKIMCLGDIIAKGTHSLGCVSLIRESCDVVIMGNTDEYFTRDHDLKDLSDVEAKRIKWNKEILSFQNAAYLRTLPFCYEFYMSGSLVRIFHASPYQLNEVVLNLDDLKVKQNMFKPSCNTVSQNNADVVIYGHIHHQYMDKLYNKTLINVGSVGNSFDVIRKDGFDSSAKETTAIHYLIIEGDYGSKSYGGGISFQFVRLPYNVKKELEDIDNNLEPESYLYELENGMYRNMEKIMKGYKDRGIKL